MSENNVPLRSEIAREFTWNAESVYPDIAAWEAELQAIQKLIPAFSSRQGTLASSPRSLAETLQGRDELVKRAIVALMYARMKNAVDLTDQENAALPGKATGVIGQVLAAVSFVEPELLQIGQQQLEQWLDKDKSLNIYAQYFHNLFRKQAHVRSAEVEELLGMLADPFASVESTASMLTNADFKYPAASGSQGESMEVTQGSLYKILGLPDRRLRQTAWEGYMDTHLAFKNTLANNLITAVKGYSFRARARRFNSTLEASLFENCIPPEVFHNLLETFRKHLPVWHRYFALRRKALGVDQLKPFDMWAPLTTQKPSIPYAQAVEWICQGLAPMGPDYAAEVRQGCLHDRWVDVYPNQGKSAGAFSYGAPGTYPFIVMSYTDDIFSLSTLAHELGHSMHSLLTWRTQPVIYSDYSLFVAEVASNFHQAMVRAHLLEQQTEREFQISLIEEAMANFFRYFLIMPTLARFEMEVHRRVEQGEGLSADVMNDLMADLFQEAYGDQVQVDRPRVGITWATFGHLYMDFYVYQYATGISAAHSLSRRILNGVPGAVDNYLKFLSAGSSLYPLDALKLAGVDMTSPQPVEETFALLSNLVDRLETLLV
ncbi:MAG: oligoendopeptidase F [Anaerolineales bacterium]|nr:oligoendopeptidase F [Anaerolineales bacterium]